MYWYLAGRTSTRSRERSHGTDLDRALPARPRRGRAPVRRRHPPRLPVHRPFPGARESSLNLGVPLGLGSGLAWGAADFFGGVQSRRLPALTVAFWSQAAGVGSGVALVLFYRSLAEGTMSVVAPISACGAVVPVAAAVLTGDHPGALAGLGVLTAIAGVVLVSRTRPAPEQPGSPGSAPPRPASPPPRSPRAPGRPAGNPGRSRRVQLMALGSALGFGLFYVFVDAGTTG